MEATAGATIDASLGERWSAERIRGGGGLVRSQGRRGLIFIILNRTGGVGVIWWRQRQKGKLKKIVRK